MVTTSDLTARPSQFTKAPVDSSHRSFGLDLARSVAIGLVLASHFGHHLVDALGFWGVELFFALSGFLIGQILWRNFSQTNNWTGKYIVNFWQRRWWRTLPNYYLFLVVMLIEAYLNKEEIPTLIGFTKFFWFGQFLLNHHWGFYSVSWSLCIEEWFYLLFPLILFVCNRLVANHKISFALTLLVVFAGSILIREILLHQASPYYLRGITLARLDAIGYGVLVAFVTSITRVSLVQKWLAFVVGISFQVFTAISVYRLGLPAVVLSPLFLVLTPLGFALMIPLLSLIPSPSASLSFIKRYIENISLWSYSIYLSHGPLMWLSYYLLRNYRDNFYGNLFSKIIAVLFTLLISAALYKFFELPFTKRRPKELKA